MRIQFMQHASFEGPAGLSLWADKAGHEQALCRSFAGDPMPGARDFDALVLLGGPMSVHDAPRLPWLGRELDLAAKAIASGRSVLGICLGAQMLATILRGGVHKAPEREIGWHPVRLTPQARSMFLFRDLPETFPALHWHGETFDIPKSAVRIAESDACENQGFIYGEQTLALQFHLEANAVSAQALIDNCPEDLDAGPFVQSEQEILSGANANVACGAVLSALLDRFFS